MFSFRDFIIFLAGMEFFHTLAHVIFGIFVKLPLHMNFIVLTPTLNIWAIIINAIITIALLWWATRLPKK